MPASNSYLSGLFGTAWHVAHNAIMTALGYASGSGSPVGSVTPTFIGQEYLDTATNNWWRAYSTANNTSWSLISGATVQGFYGTAPIAQPSAITSVTATQPTTTVYGFTTTAQFNQLIATVNQINTALVNLGLIA